MDPLDVITGQLWYTVGLEQQYRSGKVILNSPEFNHQQQQIRRKRYGKQAESIVQVQQIISLFYWGRQQYAL